MGCEKSFTSPIPVEGGLGEMRHAPLPTTCSSDLIWPAEPQGEPLTITCACIFKVWVLMLRDTSTEQTGTTDLPYANLEGAWNELTLLSSGASSSQLHPKQNTDIPWDWRQLGAIGLIHLLKMLTHRPLPRGESKGYSPRSAFSFRMSLKFKPLLSVDCLYLIKASFCPFFPTSISLTGSARKPHFHLEKSDWAHFAKSSSFTVTFSETAITSSCKKPSDENKTHHMGLHDDP